MAAPPPRAPAAAVRAAQVPRRKAPDIKALCGDKPITIAQVDGYAANAWWKINHAELQDELAACQNVKLEYSDAGGDAQKYTTQINAAIAKGVDAIVTYDTIGPQGLPALQRAHKAGVVVVPYIGNPGGKVGQDYDAFVDLDRPGTVKRWVEWLNERLGGKGNLRSSAASPATRRARPIWISSRTSSSHARTQVALGQAGGHQLGSRTGAARDGRGALQVPEHRCCGVLDYGVGSVGGMRAFVNANKPHPPLATLASSNDVGCMYEKYKDEWQPKFQILSADGSTRAVRIAARKALAKVNGIREQRVRGDAERLRHRHEGGQGPVRDGVATGCRSVVEPDRGATRRTVLTRWPHHHRHPRPLEATRDIPTRPVETLLAIEEIRHLKSRYFQAVDDKDWEVIVDIFTDNAVVDFSGEGRYHVGHHGVVADPIVPEEVEGDRRGGRGAGDRRRRTRRGQRASRTRSADHADRARLGARAVVDVITALSTALR